MSRTNRIRRSNRAVVVGGLLLGLMALPAFANTVTVTVTNTNDSGPGSLRDAIATAAPGATIDFDVTGTITLSSTLAIDKDLTIRGPGAASLSVSGNDSVVVFETAFYTTVTISGLTVTRGFNAYQGGWGGGIVNLGSLTVSDCVITGNRIPAGGGPGGGIFNYSSLQLINSVVSGNSAAYGGGGVWNNGNARLEITGSTVSFNSAGGDGGGVSNVNGMMTITRSLISRNSTQSSGGGISNIGTLTLVDSTISGNSNNGIFNWGGSTLNITGSTISGNTSVGWGGGLNSWGTVTIVNSTFASNTGVHGGGIFNYAGLLQISNSTFSGNRARYAAAGGGIWNQALLTVKSTVIADSAEGGNCGGYSGTSAGYNLSDDHSCSAFFIQPGDLNNTPAGLNPAGLQDNGGPTKTFALESTSPALNAIPAGACTDANSLAVGSDQRGMSRPQGDACDMGSFELELTTHYLLTTSVSPASGGSVTAGGSFAAGMAVSITATPAPGYRFAGFSGDLSGTGNPQSVVMDGPRSVTANFAIADATAPILTVPGDLTISASSAAGATVTFTATAVDNLDPAPAVSCSADSGTVFPLGTNTVTCIAADDAGNTSESTFIVRVVDDQRPVLAGVPGSFTVEAAGPDGARLDYMLPSASDVVDRDVPVTCSPESGSTFPLGSTTVTCSAVDDAGNGVTADFVVTVRDTTAPVASLQGFPEGFSEALTTGSPIKVEIWVTDAVGVQAVSVNGAAGTLASGTPQAGRWHVQAPVTVPGAITVMIAARDVSGLESVLSLSADNDGIAGAIDRARDGTDTSAVYSSEFRNGDVIGSVIRNGWATQIRPGILRLSGTQYTTVTFLNRGGGPTSSKPYVEVCSGATKQVVLDRTDERAEISCSSAGTMTVYAFTASPSIEVRKLIGSWSRRCLYCSRQYYSYWQVTTLTAGQSVSTGSPIAAGSGNTEPIGVQIVQMFDDGTEIVVGSFALDGGETADIDIAPGANPADNDVVVFAVTQGEVAVTIAGQTQTVSAGEEVSLPNDRVPPAIHVTAPVDGGSYILSSQQAASYTCQDADSGVVSCTGTVASGARLDTSSVGTKTFTVTARDAAGNASTRTVAYSVRYDFGGFFSPVEDPPVVNRVRAGSAVPVKFSLAGDQGLQVLEAGYPRVQTVACDGFAPLADVAEAVAASSDALTYDSAANQYTYVWKTPQAAAGSCQQLTLKLVDGTTHAATFSFAR